MACTALRRRDARRCSPLALGHCWCQLDMLLLLGGNPGLLTAAWQEAPSSKAVSAVAECVCACLWLLCKPQA
jgi:hypothetical protein